MKEKIIGGALEVILGCFRVYKRVLREAHDMSLLNRAYMVAQAMLALLAATSMSWAKAQVILSGVFCTLWTFYNVLWCIDSIRMELLKSAARILCIVTSLFLLWQDMGVGFNTLFMGGLLVGIIATQRNTLSLIGNQG